MFFYIALLIPIPYYIEKPKGVINIEELIDTDLEYKMEGTYNMAYVSEMKATIMTYLIAKLNKDWDIYKKEELYKNADPEKENKLEKDMLNASRITSKIVAFDRSNTDYEVIDNRLVVSFLLENYENNLEVGDEIISVEQTEVETTKDLFNVLQNYQHNNTVKIKVKNDNKDYTRTAKLIEEDGKIYIGIVCLDFKKLKTDVNLDIKYDSNSYGSSGGFMVALMLYDVLIPDDLTNGLKISGTGTIDEEGNVGEISGVKYKLKGAENKKADIFFVPYGENYEEALKVKKESKLDIEIVSVKTIDDAIKYLENYGL
ncbi:MAG: hypothetical protein PHU94_01280 [Bacilli bacterium]|nr:hypothetical protein [Bacilli bacterium]MDD4733693.1 hypothetical protein [Bacilli bacterium]